MINNERKCVFKNENTNVLNWEQSHVDSMGPWLDLKTEKNEFNEFIQLKKTKWI